MRPRRGSEITFLIPIPCSRSAEIRIIVTHLLWRRAPLNWVEDSYRRSLLIIAPVRAAPRSDFLYRRSLFIIAPKANIEAQKLGPRLHVPQKWGGGSRIIATRVSV